jgi:hypothetical protein
MAWSGSAITIATTMCPPRSDWLREAVLPAAALAAAPKCVMCGLAYAGLFGLGGAELCGDSPSAWSRAWPVLGGMLVAGSFLACRFGPRITSSASSR